MRNGKNGKKSINYKGDGVVKEFCEIVAFLFSADCRVGEEVLRQCRDRLAAVVDPRAASAPVSRKSSQLSSKMVLSHQKEEEEEEVEGIEEDRSLKSLLSLAKQELEEEASIKQVFIQAVTLLYLRNFIYVIYLPNLITH